MFIDPDFLYFFKVALELIPKIAAAAIRTGRRYFAFSTKFSTYKNKQSIFYVTVTKTVAIVK